MVTVSETFWSKVIVGIYSFKLQIVKLVFYLFNCFICI